MRIDEMRAGGEQMAGGQRTVSESAVIANITDQVYTANRTYGMFRILGRAEGEPFRLTRVTGRTAVMDYGDKRTLPLVISAREIAEDLCREINADAGERSDLGVFVCAGEAPTERELAVAREKLEEFYRGLVATADREWERSHSHLFIHDVQRRAAAHLGLQKDWYSKAPEYAGECPGCGERVKQGVAVCRACGAILDRDKAAALGLVAAKSAEPQASSERRR